MNDQGIELWHDGAPDRSALPVVWMVQEPPRRFEVDLANVRGYGPMVPIFPAGLALSRRLPEALKIAAGRMAAMRSGDFIVSVPGGDSLAPVVVGITLASMGPMNLNWLRWDRHVGSGNVRLKTGYYTPVRMPFRELLSAPEAGPGAESVHQ